MSNPRPALSGPERIAGAESLGMSSHPEVRRKPDLIRLLKMGLPFSALARLRARMDSSAAEIAIRVTIPMRTLARRKKEGRFLPAESERLFRIASLFDRAAEVLGDLEAARRWFRTPAKAFEGKTPLEYADTEIGAREVEDLLGRLEEGVFS
jgi:putative toxin-antitoxin system antitoxin component (TIGR02293 family)